MNFSEKLTRLNNRRNDPQYVTKAFSADSAYQILHESFNTINYPDAVKYTIGAMAEVDHIYIEKILKDGERIKKYLEELNSDSYSISFKYQGSTTNRTSIESTSDIDILVMQEKFVFSKKGNGGSYSGDWRGEQRQLRNECISKIRTNFPAVKIDNEGTYSVKLEGGSLFRKIDIVPACWDYLGKYDNYPQEYNKGIRVFDKNVDDSNTNYPFLNNTLIELKDQLCFANYRKAIRLLKNLRTDSERQIDASSYDIVSLLYNMPEEKYNVGSQVLRLVTNIKDHLLSMCNDNNYYLGLTVPDETRKISDKLTVNNLRALTVEVGDLEKGLINELSIVYKTINERVVM
jgi:hypothetical protein